MVTTWPSRHSKEDTSAACLCELMKTLCQGDCHGPSSRHNPKFPMQQCAAEASFPDNQARIQEGPGNLDHSLRRKTSRKYSKAIKPVIASVFPYS